MRLVTAKKGAKNELQETATADYWSDVGYVALGWVRRSCSYAGATDSHAHTSTADTYTHAAHTYACPFDTYARATDTYACAADSDTRSYLSRTRDCCRNINADICVHNQRANCGYRA